MKVTCVHYAVHEWPIIMCRQRFRALSPYGTGRFAYSDATAIFSYFVDFNAFIYFIGVTWPIFTHRTYFHSAGFRSAQLARFRDARLLSA